MNWAVLLESAVPVVGLIIGVVALAITAVALDERKTRKVAMCSATCSGCGWDYRGGVPSPIRCMKCGGPMTGGSGVSVTRVPNPMIPATAAHPPNPVPTPGCTCPQCTAAVSQSFSSMVANMPVQTTQPGRSVTPWGSGTKHMPVSAPISPPRTRNAAVSGMPGFAERGSTDFGLAVGSVHGLRQWNLVTPDFKKDPATSAQHWKPNPMTGATGRFQWEAGVNNAVCNNDGRHEPPLEVDADGRTCGCGFWAYWDISALATGGAMGLNLSSYVPITGVIQGTGRVLIGERGFRCQKARIIALAPAFSVQAYPPEDYSRSWARNMHGANVITDGPSQDSFERQLAIEREQADAQMRANAWMAVIQDRLGIMYPDTRVFATLKGMLASVKLGEM